MLELKNVNKTFNDNGGFEVIKNISLTAKDGEFVCILGPSGCGKTILLYLIANFLDPTSGKISIDGKSYKKPDPSRMMLFQDYILFPWKNVYDNIAFSLLKSNLTKKEKDNLIMKYLELLDLADFKDWYIHKLSGGMQQRVSLARALIVNPKILLMDEPFSALDSQYRQFLRKSLEKIWLQTKQTIIFVTHSVNEAVFLADRIYLISERPAEIKKEYKIDLPRPRDKRSPEFNSVCRQIEEAMALTFKEKSESKTLDEKLSNLLEINI